MSAYGSFIDTCPACGTRGQLSVDVEAYGRGLPLATHGFSLPDARYIDWTVFAVRCAGCGWIGDADEIAAA